MLVLPVVATLGCRAQDLRTLPPDVQALALPTHISVPAPPVAGQILWVSLADHLGRGTVPERSAPLLTLISADQASMQLLDGNGSVVADGQTLSFSWRLVPLEIPLTVARRVIGPLASFESAERLAERWRDQGVEAKVAHPDDWEVWAPHDAPDLSGEVLRDVKTTITSLVRPVLEGPEGGRTLQGPLQVRAPGGLRWNGGVMRGPFRLQADAYGSWTLLEQVPLERYLEGVVPHEIGAGSPAAAL